MKRLLNSCRYLYLFPQPVKKPCSLLLSKNTYLHRLLHQVFDRTLHIIGEGLVLRSDKIDHAVIEVGYFSSVKNGMICIIPENDFIHDHRIGSGSRDWVLINGKF